LPELVLVRRYASALEPQQPSPVQTPRTPVRPDAPAAVPASDPALPLPGETMAPVEAHVVGTKARAARPRRLYRAQPYRTLAESLTRAGRASDAKEVLIRMNRDSSAYGTMGWWGRRWSSFSDVTVRFGYSVHRTGIVLAASIILAFGLVYVGQLSDQFMAVDPTLATANVQLAGRSVGPERDAVVAATASSECTPYYPCMQPLVYTLDILVPISDFHQATYWQPKGDWQGRGGLVFLTLLAWASTTVLVSGLSRVARRDHEARSDG